MTFKVEVASDHCTPSGASIPAGGTIHVAFRVGDTLSRKPHVIKEITLISSSEADSTIRITSSSMGHITLDICLYTAAGNKLSFECGHVPCKAATQRSLFKVQGYKTDSTRTLIIVEIRVYEQCSHVFPDVENDDALFTLGATNGTDIVFSPPFFVREGAPPNKFSGGGGGAGAMPGGGGGGPGGAGGGLDLLTLLRLMSLMGGGNPGAGGGGGGVPGGPQFDFNEPHHENHFYPGGGGGGGAGGDSSTYTTFQDSVRSKFGNMSREDLLKNRDVKSAARQVNENPEIFAMITNRKDRDKPGRTTPRPLFYTVRKRTERYVTEQIAAHAANNNKAELLNAINPDSGSAALHVACRAGTVEMVKLLLAHEEINVNIPDKDGNTPLLTAVIRRNIPILKMMLERGARALPGRDLILIRAALKSNETFELIVKSVDVDKDTSVATPRFDMNAINHSDGAASVVHYVVFNNNPKMLDSLITDWLGQLKIDHADSFGNTTTHQATRRCSAECLDILMAKIPASADLMNNKGETPRDMVRTLQKYTTKMIIGRVSAKSFPEVKIEAHPGFVIALHSGNVDRLTKAMDEHSAGASVHCVLLKGQTPLHVAAGAGHRPVVEFLLGKGARVNVIDDDGNTPLHCAVRGGFLAVCSMLLLCGSDLEALDNRGRSPFALAVKYQHRDIVKDFEARGVSNERALPKFKDLDLFLRRLFRTGHILGVHEFDPTPVTGFTTSFPSPPTPMNTSMPSSSSSSSSSYYYGANAGAPPGFGTSSTSAPPSSSSSSSSPSHTRNHVEIIAVPSLVGSHLKYDMYKGRRVLIGEGNFSEVYEGTYDGNTVAIKVMKQQGPDKYEAVKKEAASMCVPRHPHIIELIGICDNPAVLVMPLFSKGTMSKLLEPSQEDENVPVTPDMELEWAIQLASAMEHLHVNGIIHGDLKTQNILLRDDFSLVLVDFGFAKRNTSRLMASSRASGFTMAFGAPETFDIVGRPPGRVSQASDVFSYGAVLWSILTRKSPYSDVLGSKGGYDLPDAAVKQGIIHGTYKLSTVGFPPFYDGLVSSCLRLEPTKRPTFADISADLNKWRRDKQAAAEAAGAMNDE